MLEPYYWHPILDRGAGAIVERTMTRHGITIIKKQAIKKVLGRNGVTGVLLKNSTACGTTVSFIGNVRPAAPHRETIAGGSVKTPRYRLFHIKENRVVGAILINSAPDIAPITALITKKIDISAHKKELADISFDVKTLL